MDLLEKSGKAELVKGFHFSIEVFVIILQT